MQHPAAVYLLFSFYLYLFAIAVSSALSNHYIFYPEQEKYERNFDQIRTILNRERVTVRTLKLLGGKDENMIRAALGLLISLLEGGHQPCQQSLLDFFWGTHEEQFFTIAKSYFDDSMVSIKEARVLQSMKEARAQKEKEVILPPCLIIRLQNKCNCQQSINELLVFSFPPPREKLAPKLHLETLKTKVFKKA